MRSTLIVLAGFSAVALLLGWSRALAHRRWAAAGHVLLGLATGGLAAWAWPAVRHVETYQVRDPGTAIAEVFIEQTATQRYRVTLTRLPKGRMQVFELAGDEWLLEVRTLDWTGHPARFGLAPRYRLERLSTRDRGAETAAAGSSFNLVEDRGQDIWRDARTGGFWSRWLVPASPVMAWQPLANGARFGATLLADRIEVEPINSAASDSIDARR